MTNTPTPHSDDGELEQILRKVFEAGFLDGSKPEDYRERLNTVMQIKPALAALQARDKRIQAEARIAELEAAFSIAIPGTTTFNAIYDRLQKLKARLAALTPKSAEPEDYFHLEYCTKCTQMTNHYANGLCAKCGNGDVDLEPKPATPQGSTANKDDL